MSILSSSPIQYTSRDYNTILNDINAIPDLASKPEWFKRMIAGVGDMLSMINNAGVNNAYLRTAYTRQAVVDLCQLIGYQVPDAQTSEGTVLFYLNPSRVNFPKTILKQDLVALSSNLRFEANNNITQSLTTFQSNNQQMVNNRLLVDRDCVDGEKVRLSGVLPQGLNVNQDYYVIRWSSTSISLATSPQNVQFRRVVSLTIPPVDAGTMTLTLYSVRVTCTQQESKYDVLVGTSDGNTAWQEFTLPDLGVLQGTIKIAINDEEWTLVESLIFSRAMEQHFQYIQMLDRQSRISFGNNQYGAIPANFPIIASYSIGGGSASNVRQIGAVNVYGGGDGDVNGVFNATQMLGGSDPQSLEMTKRIAPATLKARDRFVTTQDGETIAITLGNMAIAKCFPNAFGLLSARIIAIAKGGGNPNYSQQQTLQQLLIDRSVLNSIDVRVQDANIMEENIALSIFFSSGYSISEVSDLLRIGCFIFFSETSQELMDEYLSTGTSGVISLLDAYQNVQVTTDMTDTITRLMEALMRTGARFFGERIQESTVISFLQGNIYGIEYMQVSLGRAFPIQYAVDEISSLGSVTIYEILATNTQP